MSEAGSIKSVLTRQRENGVTRFMFGDRRLLFFGVGLLAFTSGLSAYALYSVLAVPYKGLVTWLVVTFIVACFAAGVRFVLSMLTLRYVLIFDSIRRQCSIELVGLRLPWPLPEAVRPVTVALSEVKQSVIVSSRALDSSAPVDRQWHRLGLETRDGRLHELGWGFLDDLESAKLAAYEVNQALAGAVRGD